MNDQELLTYAAKAAGIEYAHVTSAGLYLGGSENNFWSPLLNDANAFQLMVKLNLFVCVEDHEVEIFQNMNPDPLSGESLPDPRGKDYVVRKCIVVAAAEIGKGM